MKQITRLYVNWLRGYFLDLADAPLAVSVNTVTRELLLNEGVGDDRLSNVVISPEIVQGIDVQEQDGTATMWLRFVHTRELPLTFSG